MRKSALAGLFACGVVAILHTPRVSAQAFVPNNQFGLSTTQAVAADHPPVQLAVFSELAKQNHVAEPPPASAPQPEKYVVVDGETLTSIADTHQTTWQRLFYKNTGVNDPNTITAGETLVIPKPDEQLAERPILQSVVPDPANTPASSTHAPVANSTLRSSSGNTYGYGYCTYYAKNRRPDLPNNLGNADTWVSRAAAQGFATGSAPRVGAIGQQGMHVVYVESVNSDGTVTISEMNYGGWNKISSRTVPPSTFYYIYY